MALNLMKAGHELTVWNRTAAACQPLVDAGATLAGSAAEACAASDVTFVMVSTPEAAMACAEAAAPGLGAGKGYVDVSTVDAGTSAAVSKLVKGTGAEFLEAPVSGSKAPAEQGALIFMAAGDEPLYARVKGPLEVMGTAHFFLGDVGAGAKMKLIVNSVMGSMMASFAEGLSLTEAAALEEALAKDGKGGGDDGGGAGTYFFAGYDSPFRVFGRHNEVWVRSDELRHPRKPRRVEGP